MTEDLILHARHLLQRMDEKTAMDVFKTKGIKPEFVFLAVKAAKILREPYVYKESKDRIIYCEDF